MRGYEPRTHRNPYTRIRNFNEDISPIKPMQPFRNRALVSSPISKILPYSVMNRKENSPPLYSMLNPETSSDSPSARSKGARFVSANLLRNHIPKMGGIIQKFHICCCASPSFIKLKLIPINKTVISTRAILTS